MSPLTLVSQAKKGNSLQVALFLTTQCSRIIVRPMQGLLLLFWLVAFCAVSEGGQFVISGSGANLGLSGAESARSVKVAVSNNGRSIRLDGKPVTVQALHAALQEFAKQKGQIWYHRKLGAPPSSQEPLTTAIIVVADPKSDPAGAEVLEVAAEHHLPVRFSEKPDFSEGNTREVHTLKGVAIATPSPEYPQSLRARRLGGGGVFHQHIESETGAVSSVTVKQSTGTVALDRCAITALQQWRYKTPIYFKTVAVPVTFVPSKSTAKN
jgi:TonB family protein